ncbi:MAG: hypothetical protein U0527_00920 [Candidatus Eisenbacteria bacterium]
MHRRYSVSLLLGLAAMALAAPVHGATLFVDSWGLAYNQWTPNANAPSQISWVVEDWKTGNSGFLDPGWGGDEYDAEAAYIGLDSDYLYLAVITGFPLAGRNFYSDHYAAGDIMLDLGGDGHYEYAVDVDAGGALRSGNLHLQNPSIMGGHRGAARAIRFARLRGPTPIRRPPSATAPGRAATRSRPRSTATSWPTATSTRCTGRWAAETTRSRRRCGRRNRCRSRRRSCCWAWGSGRRPSRRGGGRARRFVKPASKNESRKGRPPDRWACPFFVGGSAGVPELVE